MYDTSLTRIALPSKEYLYLLGVAISVFSSNNSFIIENIIQTDHTQSWYELVDKTSGSLKPNIDKTISQVAGKEIEDHFQQICEMRNRIMHAFRITSKDGEQILATKAKEENGGEQFEIN